MTRLSNWKEESDLFEVVTGKMTDEKALKKVDEKKGIKNKVIINPKLTEAIKEMGGELIEATEEEENGGPLDSKKEAEKKSEEQKKKQIEQKQKRAQMIKKQVLMKKLIAVRQGSEDIVAHHEPEGEVLDERLGGKGYKSYTSLTGKKVSGDWEDSDRGAGNKAKKRAGGKVEKKSPTYLAHVHNKEEVQVDEGSAYGLWKGDGKRKLPGDKPKGMENLPKGSKVRVKKGVKVQGKYVKEASAVLDANTKIKNKEDRKKKEKEYAKLMSILAHRKKMKEMGLGESRDKALELVRANIIKKHGKGAIYDPKNVKKPSEADKAKAAAERKKRQDSDNKAYAARAKKAGFKSTQDYTNVVARYGSEDNYKKGRGLGT